jgi:hypothetical protein
VRQLISTAHWVKPVHPGHHRQPDGSVLRVDFEMSYWVGSLYTPERKLKAQFIGSAREVQAWAERLWR